MAIKQPGKDKPTPHGGGGQSSLERHSRTDPEPPASPAIEDLQEALRQAQQALADSHKNELFLAGLIESAMDGIISVDERQRIVLFNPAAERMFGLSAADALGQSIDMLLPEDARHDHAEHIRSFGQTGIGSRHPMGPGWVRARRANGEMFPVEASISQINVAGQRMFTSILRDVSQRMLDELILRENEERLALFAATTFEGVVISQCGRILDCNEQFARTMGYTVEELVGRLVIELVVPEDREHVAENIRLGRESLVEHAMLRKDGERILVEAHGKTIPAGAPDGRCYTVVRDITVRKQTEQALRERTERYELVLAGAQSAIWDWDVPARRVHYSSRWKAMRGFSDDEVSDREEEWSAGIHPEDRARVFAAVQDHFDGKTPVFSEEYRIRCKDGALKWISDHGIAQRDASGRVLRMAGSESDITERKRIEEALRDSQADLNRAQSVGQIGSWRLNIQRNELLWSDENHRIFDVPRGAPLTYETFLAIVHPDDRDYVDEAWQSCLQGVPYDIEHRLWVNGKVKWVREKAELEFGEQGQVLGGFGITQDITDIKLAEQALRESEARFQLASEVGRSGTWDWDVTSGEIIWSNVHYEILGYQVGEVRPSYQAWADRVHPEDLLVCEAEIQRTMAEHLDYVVEFRIVWPDGSVRWMSSRGRYEYTWDGACSRMIGVMADVTTLKQAELALLEADRRKDEFLAMLAHELRNPLAPIRNAAHVLGLLEMQEPRVQWVRKTIERQVSHLTRLVDELLDVSRIVRGKVTLKSEPVDLASWVNQALDMARPLIAARGHRIAVSLPEHAVQLEGDPVRLVQVLLNLLDNAAKYTPEGGRIALEAQVAGPLIEIQVSDNGMGIPAELLPRLFDPFQQGERTLDRSQGGLGIGLTLAKGLVEMHGGQIEALSAGAGQGSTFTIRMPVLFGVSAKPGQNVQNASPAAAYCRVLVVDDDPAVAESMVMLLEVVGHDVRSAASGDAALELARSFRPQVVLLDIGLQGMDGYEVARRLRSEQAAGEALYLMAVTGYGHEDARARCEAAGFDRHLVKPVPPHTLCKLLAEISER